MFLIIFWERDLKLLLLELLLKWSTAGADWFLKPAVAKILKRPFCPFLSSFFFASNRPWAAQNQAAHVAIAKTPQRPVRLWSTAYCANLCKMLNQEFNVNGWLQNSCAGWLTVPSRSLQLGAGLYCSRQWQAVQQHYHRSTVCYWFTVEFWGPPLSKFGPTLIFISSTTQKSTEYWITLQWCYRT